MRGVEKKVVYFGLLLSLILALAVYSPGQTAEANHECVVDEPYLSCPMHLQGQFSYSTNNTNILAVRLINATGQGIQLNQVKAVPAIKNAWGEYCAFKDAHHTRQNSPGIGEVGCKNKEANEGGYLPLEWDNTTTALAVPPGSAIYLQGRVLTSGGNDWRNTFTVTTFPQSAGVNAWRQPRVDAPIQGNGSPQLTPWEPWQNTTGNNLKIGGATIYAVSPPGQHVVDVACIYIYTSSGAGRWSYCNGVNQRGTVNFPDQVVAPNEYIVGQAQNTVTPGSFWGWAAYIYTWPAASTADNEQAIDLQSDRRVHPSFVHMGSPADGRSKS